MTFKKDIVYHYDDSSNYHNDTKNYQNETSNNQINRTLPYSNTTDAPQKYTSQDYTSAYSKQAPKRPNDISNNADYTTNQHNFTDNINDFTDITHDHTKKRSSYTPAYPSNTLIYPIDPQYPTINLQNYSPDHTNNTNVIQSSSSFERLLNNAQSCPNLQSKSPTKCTHHVSAEFKKVNPLTSQIRKHLNLSSGHLKDLSTPFCDLQILYSLEFICLLNYVFNIIKSKLHLT